MKWLLSNILLLVAVMAAPAAAETYVNQDYRFAADLPDGLAVCTTPPPGSNHGFNLLLQSKDCDVENQEQIQVFIAYNAAWEARSSRELGTHLCHGAAITQSDQVVGGLRFLRCGPFKRGTLRLTQYFALRHNPGDPVGWHTMQVEVFCQPAHARVCDRTARAVFRGLRLIKE